MKGGDLVMVGLQPVSITLTHGRGPTQVEHAELHLFTPKGTMRRALLDVPELLTLAESALHAARILERRQRELAGAAETPEAENERWRKASVAMRAEGGRDRP